MSLSLSFPKLNPSHTLPILLLLSYLSSTSALPFSPRADEEDSSWYDDLSTTSNDWCTDNPENCKAVVSVSSIIGLFIVCYLIYHFWKKRRTAKKEQDSRDRSLEVEKRMEEIKREALDEHHRKLQAQAFGIGGGGDGK